MTDGTTFCEGSEDMYLFTSVTKTSKKKNPKNFKNNYFYKKSGKQKETASKWTHIAELVECMPAWRDFLQKSHLIKIQPKDYRSTEL